MAITPAMEEKNSVSQLKNTLSSRTTSRDLGFRAKKTGYRNKSGMTLALRSIFELAYTLFSHQIIFAATVLHIL
jgi:hypothetical protein